MEAVTAAAALVGVAIASSMPPSRIRFMGLMVEFFEFMVCPFISL
jgi:hypothetical protein